MAVTYTEESKFALMDNNGGNWGAVANGIYTQLDKGAEITLVAGEAVVVNDAICIAADGTGMKADADDATRRPCIGIAVTAASLAGSFKVRRFGWIDYDDTNHGGALGATANDRIYLSSTTGRLTITSVGAFPQAVGIAKTTTVANITRILICPEFDILPFSYDPSTSLLTLTGKLYVNLVNTIAGGANCIYSNVVQSTNPLTGTLRAGYFVATNGELDSSSGTIRGIEVKARAALSDLTGGNVGVLEGASIDADAKNKVVATLRGAEIILDGQSGAAVTLAVGLRVSNNFQAAVATTSYGIHIYRDSFDYTADVLLSKGGTISGESYLDQDCRIASSPTFVGLTLSSILSDTMLPTAAGGTNCWKLDTTQTTNPLTGTLRGLYAIVTNGNFASSGTIRGAEIKARAANAALVGGNIGVLEGASISADSKDKTITTMRGIEVILAGVTGASITEAVGIRIANNFQDTIATTQYGLQFYVDSTQNTADIQLSSGGLIGGSSGDVKIITGLMTLTGNFYPGTDDTYYLGKNSITGPLAWKGVILKDTTDGNYYRVESISGVLTPTLIT